MNRYKSWSGLNKQLKDRLCEPLKNRITYFLTRYHRVHNAYGRASIWLDGKELVCFSWVEMYRQEQDTHRRWKETGLWDPRSPELQEKWNREAAFCEDDFLRAAANFLSLPIEAALASDNCLIRVFAILDQRVGKRRLEAIRAGEEYKTYPGWVRQFYELRLNTL